MIKLYTLSRFRRLAHAFDGGVVRNGNNLHCEYVVKNCSVSHRLYKKKRNPKFLSAVDAIMNKVYSHRVAILLLSFGTSHYLWRGVASKRKGLGKQNFECVKGWVNEK